MIQLVNKQKGKKITKEECNEVGSLLPALAEIIGSIEVVKQITDISVGVEQYMLNMKEAVFVKCDEVENHEIAEAHTTFHFLNNTVKSISEN